MGQCFSDENVRVEPARPATPTPELGFLGAANHATTECINDHGLLHVLTESGEWKGSSSDAPKVVVNAMGSTLFCALVNGSGPNGDEIASFVKSHAYQVSRMFLAMLFCSFWAPLKAAWGWHPLQAYVECRGATSHLAPTELLRQTLVKLERDISSSKSVSKVRTPSRIVMQDQNAKCSNSFSVSTWDRRLQTVGRPVHCCSAIHRTARYHVPGWEMWAALSHDRPAILMR